MKGDYWSCFGNQERFVVCGAAGCVVYSCKDVTKPILPPITRFGGVSCAALFDNVVAIVGRSCVREGQVKNILMGSDPNLSAWRASSLVEEVGHRGCEPEQEDEDLVRNHGPRSVRLLNLQRGAVIAELFMKSAVCGVGLNKYHVVVVLEDSTYVYNMSDILRAARSVGVGSGTTDAYGPIVNCGPPSGCEPIAILRTSLNMNGVFALSGKDERSRSLLALPGEKTGSVLLYDIVQGSKYVLENLHGHTVGALALSEDGNILASCSEEGKNITLVSTEDRVLHNVKLDDVAIRVVRRGNTASPPTCLAFNKNGTLLATASISGSVHVFSNPTDDWKFEVETKVCLANGRPAPVRPDDQAAKTMYASAWNFLKKAVNAAVPYLMKDFDATIEASKRTRIVCGWFTDANGTDNVVIVQPNGDLSSYILPDCSKKMSSNVVEMKITPDTDLDNTWSPLPKILPAAPAPAPAPAAAAAAAAGPAPAPAPVQFSRPPSGKPLPVLPGH